MRTTIRLDERLLKSAKRYAHDTGRTLTALIEDSLRQALSPKTVKRGQKPIRIPTVSGRGLHPGVELDDSAALLTLMEQRNGPS